MGDGEQRTGSSIGRVLAVQAVAYVVLFGVTGVLEFTFGNQGGVAQGVAIALAVVLLVLFQVGWPFRAGIADRLIGAVAGVLSILCARTSLASQLFYPAYEGGRLADDGRLVMYQLRCCSPYARCRGAARRIRIRPLRRRGWVSGCCR